MKEKSHHAFRNMKWSAFYDDATRRRSTASGLSSHLTFQSAIYLETSDPFAVPLTSPSRLWPSSISSEGRSWAGCILQQSLWKLRRHPVSLIQL